MKPQPLTEEHLPAAVALAAAAFANSVAYVSICPDAHRRREFLEWLFTVNARRGMEHGYARCVVDDEGEVICFFLLEPPGIPKMSTWDMIRAGLLGAAWRFGLASTRRLIATKDYFEASERRVLGARAGKVSRLNRLTVLPARQGQGVGSTALAAALRDVDAPVMLETQDSRNVAFYERLGFAVIDEDTCPIGEYHTWSMLREACGGGVGFRNQGNDPNQNPTFPPGTATGPFVDMSSPASSLEIRKNY